MFKKKSRAEKLSDLEKFARVLATICVVSGLALAFAYHMNGNKITFIAALVDFGAAMFLFWLFNR